MAFITELGGLIELRRTVAAAVGASHSERLTYFSETSSAKIIKRVQAQRIMPVTRLAGEAVKSILGRAPRIAVAGLNPHAGEHGLFGQEEQENIKLSIHRLAEQGWQVFRLVSADTV